MGLFNFRSKKAPGDADPAADDVAAQSTVAPAAGAEPSRSGWLARMRAKLNRGNSWLTYDLANLLPGGKIDENVLDELETRLIAADVGIETTEKILGSLRKRVQRQELADLDALLGALRSAMLEILQPVAQPLVIDAAQQALRDPGRRRERLRQDDDDRQARAPLHRRGPQGDARRRRHLPRRGDRAAAGLGRTQPGAGDRAGRRARIRPRSSSTRCSPRRRAASTC